MKRVAMVVLAALSIGMTAADEASAPDSAESAARAALVTAEREHGATSRATADALAALVDAQRDDFSIETHATEVEAFARREVELRAKLDGESSLAYAKARGHLGYALAAEYAYDEAQLQFDRAYAIVAALGEQVDANTRAQAEIDRGYIRRMQRRDFDEAARMIQSGLSWAPGLPPLRRAQALLSLAACEFFLKHADRLGSALDRANVALREAHAERHPYQAELLLWRSYAELDAGHFPAAIALSDRAIMIASKATPYSKDTYTSVLRGRGQLESRLNNFKTALDYGEQVLELQQVEPTSGGYWLGVMQADLCSDYGLEGQIAAAEPHCRAAVAALEAMRFKPAIDLASANNNLSAALMGLGRDGEAIEPLKRSLYYASTLGDMSSWSSYAEINLADVHLRLGHFGEAESLFRRHLARIEANDDFALQNPRWTRVGLAAALWGENRLDEAFASAAEAERSAALVRHVSASDLDEQRALHGLGSLDGGLDWMVAISNVSLNPVQIEQTWNAVLEARGTVSAMVARRLSTARAATDPRVAEVWNRWQASSAQLARARVALAQSPAKAKHDALINAEHDFDQADLSLAAQTGSNGDRLLAAHGTWPDVRSALPADAALVRFIESAARPQDLDRVVPPPVPMLYALIATRRIKPRILSLGKVQTIADAATAWYRLATTPDSDAHALAAASIALRRQVVDPIIERTGTKRVLLIPSPILERINFAALQTDAGRYLVEGWPQFHLLEHERDLLRETGKSRSPKWLLAGAPDFAGAQSDATDSRGNCDGLRASPFAPLPGARAELAALDRLGNGVAMNTILLEGKDATEAAVRGAIPQASNIHFATHGFFLGKNCTLPGPENSRGIALVGGSGDDTNSESGALSALVFSGANSKGQDGASDGLLTSDEIAALDLGGTDWAVLSACETALGEVIAQEGVLGLRRAFHLAGARTVIMSLWRVDDLATTQFMQALYRARLQRHADTIDSMYAAMRETLAARRRAGESTSPYYWAGFVAAGDWR